MTKKKDQEDVRENFWEAMERGAAIARTLPSWMKGGINLNEKNFVTFRAPQTESPDEE